MTNKSRKGERQILTDLLRELRKEKAELTQTELSARLGRPQSYVSKYENGERRLDYVEVREICAALSVSMQSFDRMYDDKLDGKHR